jgi:hypothetical protein
MKELARTLSCLAHPHGQEVWVTCTHTEQVTHARFVNATDITGEALCPECQALVDQGTPERAPLRLACGACVRTHFRLPEKALS